MASESLRQRPRDAPSISTTASGSATASSTNRRARKMAMARKGLRSLAIAVVVPLMLSAVTAYLSGCSSASVKKRTWHPPVWAFHLASVSTAAVMGLSAWLVWAEGAFHHEPAVLGLYLGQQFLSLLWSPLVFGLGAVRAGLVVCIGLFGLMMLCAMCFKKVNPIAGDLVKPCLAWASFLIVFNYKLV